MNTTYDDIYKYFSRNIRADSLDLPSTIDEQIELLKDGIDEYNLRLEKNLNCDDMTETVSEELNNLHIRFIIECMKLRIFQGMLEDYVSVWETFQGDMGRKNYKDQLNARQSLINKQDEILNKLSNRIYDNYTGGDE